VYLWCLRNLWPYMRNRWYEPQSGRFLSEDPIGLNGGINLYAFAGDNPVSRGDPSGTKYREQRLDDPGPDYRGVDNTFGGSATLALMEGSDAFAELLDAGTSTNSQCPGEAGTRQWPTRGGHIWKDGGDFGWRTHPRTQQLNFHRGVDIDGLPVGASVFAMTFGKVLFAGERSGYGNMIEMSHPGGYRTRYGHLSDFSVAKNDIILSLSKEIGKLGNSGVSTAPHLHFEIIAPDGSVVDPKKCFP
jgi:murein DD-endopeptidase MepM/ murein hydrolase activator NlpD